ncbi:TRAP transporter small permease subunit [Pseudoduganella sp. FT25W]|uniref:TRAP transporter small permease protein n=1 Tax=Duganella alba TaxID=2666081 RepID=A0A6L5QK20_9BURK|nr:TRAP transporter small permease subunit [Duganella alba]MRX17780.1 TRAP transporter small permease subunit [Duganella alba]
MTKILDHLEEWIITLLMGGATLIIFLSVVHRYGTGLPIPYVQDYLLSLHFEWAQELAIIMFVWMAKFGAAYGVRKGVHVGVDVLVNRMPTEWRRFTVLLAIGCGMLFTGIVGTLGLTFVWENGMHHAVYTLLGWDASDVPEGPTTPDLEWPTWFIYSAVPMGSYLMCFRFIQVGWTFLRHGELPHHDESHVEGLDDEEDDELFAAAPSHQPAHGGAR